MTATPSVAPAPSRLLEPAAIPLSRPRERTIVPVAKVTAHAAYAALQGLAGKELVERAFRHILSTGAAHPPTAQELATDAIFARHFGSGDELSVFFPWRARLAQADWRLGGSDPIARSLLEQPREDRIELAQIAARLPFELGHFVASRSHDASGATPEQLALRGGAFWQQWFADLAVLIAKKDIAARLVAKPTPTGPVTVRADGAADMPVLGAVVAWANEHWPTTRERFADVRLCAVQHYIELPGDSADRPASTTEDMFAVMEEQGLDRFKAALLGKPYSASPSVVAAMRADGWDIDPLSNVILPTQQLDRSQARTSPAIAAYRLLQRTFANVDLANPPKERILILDDGGYLIRALHEDPSPWGESLRRFAHLCTCVEQTTSGLNNIRGLELLCPVVSVAGSYAKRHFESPFIGESICESVRAEMTRPQWASVRLARTAVVRGFGAVGEAAAKQLVKRGFEVYVDDSDPKALQRAERQGLRVEWTNPQHPELGAHPSRTLRHGNLLVSAAGEPLPPEHYGHLPWGAFIANVSSNQNDVAIRRSGSHGSATNPNADSYFPSLDETVHLGEQSDARPKFSAYALRGGFVVNMRYDIPRPFIQLTRGLTLAGCMQALRETRAEVIDLDARLEAHVVDTYLGDLRARGLDPMNPDFGRRLPHRG